MLRFVVAATAVLIVGPAMAQQSGIGGGFTNIWSSAQGTSNSYGGGAAFSESASGSLANAAGRGGLNGFNSFGNTQAITSSRAGTISNGSGYAQAQTSGYAGGTVAGSAGRIR